MGDNTKVELDVLETIKLHLASGHQSSAEATYGLHIFESIIIVTRMLSTLFTIYIP